MDNTQGTGVMSLYNNNRSAGLGTQMGGSLQDYEMTARQKMAPPVGGQAMERPAGAPEWYNYQGMLPAKYAIPNEMKDRMVAKQAIREAAQEVSTAAVPRPDPLGEEELNYLQTMQKQAELADFDRYINTLVDPRKPGNLKWLMEVYPEFVSRRIAQVHDDYDFAIRKQMIDSWGVNTFDDLHFLYLCDQGKIEGPQLSKRVPKDAAYTSSYLAPYQFGKDPEPGVQLPFASATTGQQPQNDRTDWTQSDTRQPLAGGRSLNEMARSVLDINNKQGDGGIRGTAQQLRGPGIF